MKLKRNKITRIYTIIISMMCILGMSCIAYAEYQMTAFSYYGYHAGYSYRTAGLDKKNDSPAVVSYISGPAATVNVEVWGSDAPSGDALNLTINGSLDYYTVSKGYYMTLHNTVYEHYIGSGFGKLARASLRIYTYDGWNGYINGQWSPYTE